MVHVCWYEINWQRVSQADNTQKSPENGNPIEELCIRLAAVLEHEMHMSRPVKIGDTVIVCVTYVGIFYLINQYGFRHGKCEQILANCCHSIVLLLVAHLQGWP